MRTPSAALRPLPALAPPPTRPRARRAVVAAANDNNGPGPSAPVDSDAAYVAKLAAASVVGALEWFEKREPTEGDVDDFVFQPTPFFFLPT